MPTLTPINVAVLGVGRIGQVHADTLASRVPLARLAGLADVNAKVAVLVALSDESQLLSIGACVVGACAAAMGAIATSKPGSKSLVMGSKVPSALLRPKGLRRHFVQERARNSGRVRH